MDTDRRDPAAVPGAARRLSRRRVLRQGGAGLAAVLAPDLTRVAAQEATPVGEATPPVGSDTGLSEAALRQLEADIEAAMGTFNMVGAAVALVDRSGIRYRRGFGVRDLASDAPVTPDTHFLVASTTKSMSSLLVATLVDDGALAWDQLVREVWPDFRAPTDELTTTLRVRDLLGMDSGIGEPPAVSTFHQGDVTAGELMRSLAALPVTDPPHSKYFYNNTVYAVGGYLPALVQGTADDQLETVYARLMQERVYRPAGMATARITDDPRLFVTDYATGYGPDFTQGMAAQPYAPVGSYAPVGGTLASLTDMAAYVAMQLNGGTSATGERVVSAANLAECWNPHIDLPTSPELDPDLVSAGYGMGWISQTYRDGRRLVWHNGGIDGFASYIGFFPQDDLGLVVLTNMGPLPRGLYFAPYVLNLLLSAHFGLNLGVNETVVAQYQAAEQHLSDLAAQAEPVDPSAVAPYLGDYEKGWRVAFDADDTLRLHQSSRDIPLMALPDGSYVMASGVLPGNTVRFSRDADGMPWLEIQDIETVRWSSGPA
jgi:CubicO group peptidase (beta-lactamase class C family)